MIIETPNFVLLLAIAVLPMIIGAVLFLRLLDSRFATVYVYGSVTLSLLILFLVVLPIVLDYNEQVHKLIDTTDCKTISSLADDYPDAKRQVVDEVILRCLNDNPGLKDFVLENKH